MTQMASATDSVTNPSQSSVWIGLLGQLTITRAGQRIELSGPKRRALLTLLSLHIDDPLGREQIIEALWPRRQTGREDSTLRVHISHLRDELEIDRERDPKVLLTRGQAYLLSSHVVDTDVRRFDELVRAAKQHIREEPGVAVELLDEALALWRGRPLQDVEYEEFAQDEVRRLDRARIGALRDRAEAMIGIGEDAAAIHDLEPLVRDDPTDEGAVSLLMLALYRTGRQSEALSVASRLSRQLRDRGLEPSPRVVLLEEQIVNHDPDLLPEGTLAPGEIKPGRSVRGYELREEAGRGSIGVVYRAFQPAVGREVAVKVINPDLAQSPEFVRRFAEEAKVIASLEHPHIVPLHDFWREPGGAFLVMRWMDGGSLTDRLAAAWGEDRLARVFDQVAAALGFAHSCGIVHRDVKPENILFDSDDNAYLCDFGLAAAGIETGVSGSGVTRTAEPPYAAPELFREGVPTVASDIFGLGVLLAETASGVGFPDARSRLSDRIWEVVSIATATSPADRYPDVAAFRMALREAIGDAPSPAPRTVRRNPYKGLEPFDEIDSADFYGRDDVVESLLDTVASKGLVALIGASGSGKSSVVRAGLIPQLRDGALPGSDQWSVVTMYPGDDPFEEFRVALRDAAVGPITTGADRQYDELRELLLAALDGPTSRALLAVDQFEELFSSSIDEETRGRFLDNLVDLASDPMGRFRVVLTMRADFSDRPLSHPTFGDFVARSSLLLGPMRPDQLEDVIRRPAARVGIQVEPGLISEIIRDVTDAPAYLPLLQYVLAELFERRSQDRLTVQAYRSLGGVQGVVERRAEATFASLDEDAKAACRQLFLRMVHLGDHGEETRRRLPLNEVAGLGARAAGEAALEAFSSARLIAYDRDPVSRTPTVEVAHETVIARWTRYRVWIDEARTDLLIQRRVSASARTWVHSDGDPAYLLTGGPLNEALDLVGNQRVELNELETRFVEESRMAARAAEEHETRRRQHEAELEQRSRRRLGMGLGIAAVAVVIAVLAVVAWNQSQRASDIAAMQEQESLARELAAISVNSLSSADSDLSLLLAIAAAEETLEADGEIVPEAVDAMHRALINPSPDQVVEGAARKGEGKSVSYSSDGTLVAVLTDDGGVMVVDPATGDEIARLSPMDPPALGAEFHPHAKRVMTIHEDAVREWDWRSGRMLRELPLPEEAAVTTAAYSKDGSRIAIGSDDGLVRVFVTVSGRQIATLEDADLQLDDGQDPLVYSVDFDPSGTRLVTSSRDQSRDGKLLTWHLGSEEVIAELSTETPIPLLSPLTQVAWQPAGPVIVGVTTYGETLAFNGSTGERFTSYGNGNFPSNSVAFDGLGVFLISAGGDGVARAFGTLVGGEAWATIPSGGVPLLDAAFNPARATDPEVATVGTDGKLRIWRNLLRSELPIRAWTYINPRIASASDAGVYAVAGTQPWYGLPIPTVIQVVDGENNESLLELPAHRTQRPFVPAINADGSRIAYVGPDGDIMVADVDAGTTEIVVPRREIELESPPFSGRGVPGIRLALSSDGTLLAWAGESDDGVIRTWDIERGERDASLVGHGDRIPEGGEGVGDPSQVEQIAFRPGSSRELGSVGHDGTVRMWNVVTGEGSVLAQFDYAGHSLAYSRDGELLAVSDRTGTVWILDPETGELALDPEDVSGPTWLSLTPDGQRLIGGGPGPFVNVWDLDTGLITRRLQGSVYWPNDVAFIDEGRKVLVMSTEGVLRGYHLDPKDLLEAARGEVGREMTEKECRHYLGRPCDD